MMKTFTKWCAVACLVLSGPEYYASAQDAGWNHGDIGATGVAGASSYNAPTDTYSIEGSGDGIGGTADAFQFMFRTLSGDGEIVARVITQANTGAGARAGLMIRDGNAPGARNAFVHTTISSGIYLQSRAVTGGTSAGTNLAGSAPEWLKMVREGTLISGYHSVDGVVWTLIDAVNLPLPYDVSIGVAVTSGNNSVSGAAMFDHLEVAPVEAPLGLSGFYFQETDFSNLRVIRRDGAINFDWEGLMPESTIEPGDYSVRWKGDILPAFSEAYTFYMLADDRVRLWVNGQLVIDNWTGHSLLEDSGTITLTQGQSYQVKVEYARSTGNGVAVLSWSSLSRPKEVVPFHRFFNLDMDDDGMSDAWEILSGLDPLEANNPVADPDGDGVTDLQESLANTSRADPAPQLTLYSPSGASLTP